MESGNGHETTLRVAADRRGVRYGCAVGRAFWDDNDYRELVRRQCGIIVAENAMKFGLIQPERGRFDWSRSDDLVRFAQDNGMDIRGHCLVWHQQAGWAAGLDEGRDAMLAVMREHIHTVVGRYRGKICEWDVVNEAVDDGDAALRDTFWRRTIGDDHIDAAFRFAHEADPGALLYYNDYGGEDMGRKSDRIYELVSGMLKRGVPVHGVGLQCHFAVDKVPTADIGRNIRRLTALGLQVAVTELDIRVPLPADENTLALQAACYKDVLKVFLENRGCRHFLTWGITDRYSWVPGFFKGAGAALPFDGEYRVKPAVCGMLEVLGKEIIS